MRAVPFLAVLALTALACDGTEGPPPDAGEPPDAGAAPDAGDDGRFTLTVEGTGFAASDGKRFLVALVRTANDQVDDVRSGDVASGAFSIVFPDLLVAERPYRLDTFADVDGDGLCDASADEVRREVIGAVEGDTTVSLTPTETFEPDACASFARYDLTFRGEGFTPHDGETIHVALVNAHSNRTTATETTTVADGAFDVRFPEALGRAAAYRVDYFADTDGDGLCEAPDPDRAWRTNVGLVSHAVSLSTIHSIAYTSEACASFTE